MITARQRTGVCGVCGREFVRENAGRRGRAKFHHPECRELLKAIGRVSNLLREGASVDGEVRAVEFADQAHARKLKGLLFSLVNSATNTVVIGRAS